MDEEGEFDVSAGKHEFKPLRAGTYLVMGTVLLNGLGSTSAGLLVQIKVNGYSGAAFYQGGNSGGAWLSASTVQIQKLAAGDSVTLWVTQSSGMTKTLLASAQSTSMAVVRLK